MDVRAKEDSRWGKAQFCDRAVISFGEGATSLENVPMQGPASPPGSRNAEPLTTASNERQQQPQVLLPHHPPLPTMKRSCHTRAPAVQGRSARGWMCPCQSVVAHVGGAALPMVPISLASTKVEERPAARTSKTYIIKADLRAHLLAHVSLFPGTTKPTYFSRCSSY